MINWFLGLDIDVRVNIISIIMTGTISLISIIIAILTLRQNSKVIREANRPSLSITLETISISSMRKYLVLRNFGNTPAKIESIECSVDINSILYINLFEKMNNCTIAPNQSIVTICRDDELENEYTFTIKYSSGKRKFTDISYINTSYVNGLMYAQYSGSNKTSLEKTILNSAEELIKSKF